MRLRKSGWNLTPIRLWHEKPARSAVWDGAPDVSVEIVGSVKKLIAFIAIPYTDATSPIVTPLTPSGVSNLRIVVNADTNLPYSVAPIPNLYSPTTFLLNNLDFKAFNNSIYSSFVDGFHSTSSISVLAANLL